MSPIHGLIQIFFIMQATAIVLLLAAYSFDYDTYKQIATGRWAIIPRLRKSAKLFGLSRKPLFQIIYLFSAIFTLFSYVSFILLVVYTIGWFTGLL